MSVFTKKDKTQYADTYFPERNGIKPVVKDGRNFDNDTLFYMSKPKVAQYIADKVESFTFGRSYFLIEICSGVGGNTLEFLSRKNCASLIAFERDKKRSLYLKRNITAYKFDDKAIVIDDEITGNEDFGNFKDAIFYFDPPWLPEDYKSADADYKKHYIRKGIKIGKLTLEKWLAKLKDVAYMVAFRVGPADYDLGEIDGWTYQVENLGRDEARRAQAEDGKLYFCFNNKHIKGASEDKFGGYAKSIPMLKSKLIAPSTETPDMYLKYKDKCNNEPMTKAVAESCPFLKYKFIDPEPEVAPVKKTAEPVKTNVIGSTPGKPVFGNKPIEEQVWRFNDIPSPPKKIENGSPEWIAEFQNYLAIVLGKFIADKNYINQILGGDNIKTWLQAFTDESYAPQYNENYQSLETLGDGILKFAFKEYLFEIFARTANSHGITQYNIKYEKDVYLIALGKSFKFGEWVIHSPLDTPIEKVNEDLVESFIAALYLTGNNVSSKTLFGMRLVQKFVKFYSQQIVFDEEELIGDDMMTIDQDFAMFGLGKNYTSIFQLGQKAPIQIQVTIPMEGVKKLQEAGIPITSKVIGTGVGDTKSQAKRNAYQNARENLASLGFTRAFVKGRKAENFMKRLQTYDNNLSKLFKTVLSNMNIDYNTDIEFDKKAQPDNRVLIILKANQDGKTVKLGEGIDKDEFDARVKAIKNFIDNN